MLKINFDPKTEIIHINFYQAKDELKDHEDDHELREIFLQNLHDLGDLFNPNMLRVNAQGWEKVYISLEPDYYLDIKIFDQKFKFYTDIEIFKKEKALLEAMFGEDAPLRYEFEKDAKEKLQLYFHLRHFEEIKEEFKLLLQFYENDKTQDRDANETYIQLIRCKHYVEHPDTDFNKIKNVQMLIHMIQENLKKIDCKIILELRHQLLAVLDRAQNFQEELDASQKASVLLELELNKLNDELIGLRQENLELKEYQDAHPELEEIIDEFDFEEDADSKEEKLNFNFYLRCLGSSTALKIYGSILALAALALAGVVSFALLPATLAVIPTAAAVGSIGFFYCAGKAERDVNDAEKPRLQQFA